MMKLTALKIDPEFQGKIPPLTSEELDQLEKNIVSDGKVINPIIVWNGLIIDGHNRYAILQKHPDIQYAVHEKEFADRYEAIVWICKNQLGRRNLTVEQKKYLVGKQYEAEKALVPNEKGTNRYTVLVGAQNEHQLKRQKTCEKIAAEIGSTPIFVRRSEEFAKGVDAAEEAVPGTRRKVLSGEVKPTAAEIASVARAPPEDRPALVEKSVLPKKQKSPAVNQHPNQRKLKSPLLLPLHVKSKQSQQSLKSLLNRSFSQSKNRLHCKRFAHYLQKWNQSNRWLMPKECSAKCHRQQTA